jgi:glycosyltransferase involved in cell wall biosynthesis
MKVLFLTHSFPRSRGDAPGSFLLRLAEALRGEGTEVHVVAPGARGLAAEESFDGVPVERFRYAPRRYETLAYTGTMAEDVRASFAAKLALVGFLGSEFRTAVRAARRTEPDIVHAHWWFPGGLVGSWMNGLSRVPLVTTLHGTDVRLARSVGVARPLFRSVIARSTTVTAVSRWLAGEARALVPGVEPVVAPMPVADELFAPGGVRSTDRLLFVGRLNKQKGLALLLRALAITETGAALDVIGDGPDEPELRHLSGELGVADRVSWLGIRRQPALAEYYRRAAALIVPSVDEGLGLVAVEGLLCEAPVIAFASGGVTDSVRHDVTGILVPPGDVGALAGAIDGLLRRSDRGATLGRAGRLHALSAFAPASVARRYMEIYLGALASRAT